MSTQTQPRSAVADELLRQRLARITTQEHVLAVVETLGAEAKAQRERGVRDGNNSFRVGLYTGYVQAIRRLLDCTYDQAKALVEGGWL